MHCSTTLAKRIKVVQCLKVTGARTVVDIGVFTGASSLAAALAVGELGKVYALEKSRTYASIAR